MRFALCDRWGGYRGELRPWRAVRTRATDGTDELELTCSEPVEKGDRVLFVDSMGRVCEYTVGEPETERASTRAAVRVRCVGSMQDDLGLKVIESVDIAGATSSQALEAVLRGTAWVPGRVEAGSGQHDVSWERVSAASALEELCQAFGLEVEQEVVVSGAFVSERRVNLLNRLGADTTRRFEYGRDLTAIRRIVSSTPVYTRLYGYGKGVSDGGGGATEEKLDFASVNGGVPWVEDAEATAVWGLPDGKGGKIAAEGVYENGDCEDARQLLDETRAALKEACEPKVTYEADVVALSRAGFDAKGVDVGDGVSIVDTAFPGTIRLQGRVMKLEEDLLAGPSGTTITLGNITRTLTQRNDAVQSVVDRLTGNAGAWDDAAALRESFVTGVIEGVNAVLNETGGYTYLKPGEGIFVYDRPEDENPTMAIQIGGGYFRIADGKTSTGDWAWRTLGTGHGLVADELVSGMITGGSNSWNLETGDLSFSQGVIRSSDSKNTWNLSSGDLTLAGDVTLTGGRIQSADGSSFWDLTSGQMQLNYTPPGLDEDVQNALSKANQALQEARDASADVEDVSWDVNMAKVKTDRILFTDDGMQIVGSDGVTTNVATYNSRGFIVDAPIAEINSSNGQLGVKDWGMAYTMNSGGVGMWITDGTSEISGGTAHFRALGPGFDFIVNSTGVYYNSTKLA